MKFKNDTRKYRNIRSKLLLYFILFVLGIMLTLWFFQTALIDDFYEALRINNIKEASRKIEQTIDDDTVLRDVIDEISYQDNVCVHVLDDAGNQLYNTEQFKDCILHKKTIDEIKALYELTIKEGGSLIKKEERVRIIDTEHPEEDTVDSTKQYGLVYSKTLNVKKANDRIVLITTNISPLDSTVTILKIQLLYVAVMFIFAATLLALILSSRLANPIIKINNSAKILGEGDYNVRFDADGYREICELRDTLNEAAIELGKVEKLQDELIANISHDLRTPLTMINGYSEVMRDIPGENTPENVQVIIDETNRLTRLVNDILDLSKIKAGVEQIILEEINLTQIIKDNIERCAKLKEVQGYKIKFEYDEEVFVEADDMKISQVVYNLIGNAITYTGQDKTVIARQEIIGDKVRISVTDTGKGIEEEKLKDIWERYYKIDNAHRRAAVGTGLGLSIVKSIMDKHNGVCGVESKLNEGSTFWFELNRK